MAYDPVTGPSPGRVSPGFVRLAGVCALLTALTTLGVHWLPDLWKDVNTFDAEVQLQHNSIYMAQRWMILLHCVLVVISMAAIPMLVAGNSKIAAMFGLGAFIMFAFVEMLRTSLSIFAINRAWRHGYEISTDEIARTKFRFALESFAGVNDALFFLFLAAFTAGLFLYGAALYGIDRRIAWVFLLWGFLNFPGVVAEITTNQSITRPFAWVGPYFQPIARLLIGIWLWNTASKLNFATPQPSQQLNLST